jgi:Zn-dependent protease
MHMDSINIFAIVILILSVIIHEISHGYAALALGDPTAKYEGRLTLNPIPHLDLYGSFIVPLLLIISHTGVVIGWAKPVPFNPYNLRNQRWGEAIVAVAGPLSNISLAVIFGLVIRFAAAQSLLNQSFLNLAGYVILINITLAIFNLVPIPPLDGSKILFAFLPYKWQSLRASLERYGLILVLIFVFFLWQIISPVVGFLFNFLVGQPVF